MWRTTLNELCDCVRRRFFALLIKEAIVYALYMCINTFLPAFVVSKQ